MEKLNGNNIDQEAFVSNEYEGADADGMEQLRNELTRSVNNACLMMPRRDNDGDYFENFAVLVSTLILESGVPYTAIMNIVEDAMSRLDERRNAAQSTDQNNQSDELADNVSLDRLTTIANVLPMFKEDLNQTPLVYVEEFQRVKSIEMGTNQDFDFSLQDLERVKNALPNLKKSIS